MAMIDLNVPRNEEGFFPNFEIKFSDDDGEVFCDLSIQASEHHYCSPKIQLDHLAEYSSVEIYGYFMLKEYSDVPFKKLKPYLIGEDSEAISKILESAYDNEISFFPVKYIGALVSALEEAARDALIPKVPLLSCVSEMPTDMYTSSIGDIVKWLDNESYEHSIPFEAMHSFIEKNGGPVCSDKVLANAVIQSAALQWQGYTTAVRETGANSQIESRESVANSIFQDVDFGLYVGETDGWVFEGNSMRMNVYLENPDDPDAPSTKGSFEITFHPNSDKQWVASC
jgi:hypothetical protein